MEELNPDQIIIGLLTEKIEILEERNKLLTILANKRTWLCEHQKMEIEILANEVERLRSVQRGRSRV